MRFVCPECGRSDRLKIETKCVMSMLQDEDGNIQTIDDDAGVFHEWDTDSWMTCECGAAGVAAEFDTEEE